MLFTSIPRTLELCTHSRKVEEEEESILVVHLGIHIGVYKNQLHSIAVSKRSSHAYETIILVKLSNFHSGLKSINLSYSINQRKQLAVII